MRPAASTTALAAAPSSSQTVVIGRRDRGRLGRRARPAGLACRRKEDRTTHAERAHRRLRPGFGLIAAVEVLCLGALAAFLVLWAIPHAFEIEWSCLGGEGVVRRSGDSYGAGVALAGTFGWLLVAVATLFALITESRRAAAVLPLAWFLAFVLGALLAAAAMSPQLCTGG